jgi:hypothetical protein
MMQINATITTVDRFASLQHISRSEATVTRGYRSPKAVPTEIVSNMPMKAMKKIPGPMFYNNSTWMLNKPLPQSVQQPWIYTVMGKILNHDFKSQEWFFILIWNHFSNQEFDFELNS